MSGINENVAKATLLEQNLDEKINLATSWRATIKYDVYDWIVSCSFPEMGYAESCHP